MKLSDLISPGEAGGPDVEIAGLTLDSRAVKPGFLFAALPGLTVDGRDYIPQAIAAGAVAVLTEAGVTVDGALAIHDADPVHRFAEIAARFYPCQPGVIAAVTGTNGKSSTVDFLRQIWRRAGIDGASLGTLGVARGEGWIETGYTTPDAAAVHAALDKLATDGCTHLAMEASSHGLKQKRMDAVRVTLTGFTNLTQDHLDYHPDFADYFASKMKLFLELAEDGSPAIINVDSDWGGEVAQKSAARGLDVTQVGWSGRDWRIRELAPKPASQVVTLEINGKTHKIELPLVGEFQVANAVGAAAMATRSGVDLDAALAGIGELDGVPGRLELAARTSAGAPVLVDFAHTPDGLDKLIRAARPHTRGRIFIVFGCGGDRDPTKRRPMGEIAVRLADRVIVTDDNPRSEDPATIRAAVLQGARGALEIGDRAQAIRAALETMTGDDTLLIAGKGHETGQKIGDIVHPFDDREEARKAVAAMGGANG
ncbi:UDP-N-acetylmuramoyl-L-alanyl-D-glutamate--2,6-diaminopimelate ligase [Hyphobacterium sp.]|uniref:UDP-N-acetylmuramoyl-L-alanyl-D-glutamate--2, 6-diaminopimelate ligase n=1 Tax=Hyphobacterium sp. TaxID=2004662 RepID=UPI003B51C1B1